MSKDKMALKHFEPGSYIEITDTIDGFRKVGVVTEGGDMYFDQVTGDCTPFPIYEALEPAGLGNPLSWGLELAETNPAEHASYIKLSETLLAGDLDSLTVARALLWASRNHVYDYSRVLAEARAATNQVAQSRSRMDRIIRKGALA